MSTLGYMEARMTEMEQAAVSKLAIIEPIIARLLDGLAAAKNLSRTGSLLTILIAAHDDLVKERDTAHNVLDELKAIRGKCER